MANSLNTFPRGKRYWKGILFFNGRIALSRGRSKNKALCGSFLEGTVDDHGQPNRSELLFRKV
jgi:hypothetical protein